jgi:hypothetical protein
MRNFLLAILFWVTVIASAYAGFAYVTKQPAGETPTWTVGVNVARDTLGVTGTDSSNLGANYVANKAIDNSMGTRWTSAFSDPQWIEIDLGWTQEISQVIINWENAQVYDDEYLIQHSTTGGELGVWTTVWNNVPPANEDKATHTITFTSVVANRYWRMYGISRNAGWGHSIWEFGIYDTVW